MSIIEPLRLSQLAKKVDLALKSVFTDLTIWVVADVTSHTYKSSSNYHFFELVEKEPGQGRILAKFPAKAWGAGARNIQSFEARTGQQFSNHIQVLVQVFVEYHAVYGIQLTVNDIDINYTIGVIEQQRQATLDRLVNENPESVKRIVGEYWTKNKDHRLPLVIQKIAVISSKDSAGLQDFMHTLEVNGFGYQFDVVCLYAGVQGETNTAGIRKVLVSIYESAEKYDMVVLVRGGGSQADLLLFDQYVIGQAIARFPIPILTGIGHTKNISVADLMAHTSMKTPTKCAEFIIDHNRKFEETVLNTRNRITIRSQQYLANYYSDLNNLHRILAGKANSVIHLKQMQLAQLSNALLSKPALLIASKQQSLVGIIYNIKAFSDIQIRGVANQLAHYQSLVRLIAPANLIKRGYAILKQGGKIISNPDLLDKNTDIQILIRDQELTAQLKDRRRYDGNS